MCVRDCVGWGFRVGNYFRCLGEFYGKFGEGVLGIVGVFLIVRGCLGFEKDKGRLGREESWVDMW